MILCKGDGRPASAGVEHGNVAEEFCNEVLGLRLGLGHCRGLLGIGEFLQVAQLPLEHVSPGRQVIPARPARGLRMRRNHGNARLNQVGPIVNLLWIPLADEKHDGRGIRRTVMGEPLLPVGWQQAGLLVNRVDVVSQGQRHHRRLQPLDHRAGLLTRAAMRHANCHRLAGRFRPMFGERRVEFLVQLARGVIGNVQQHLWLLTAGHGG